MEPDRIALIVSTLFFLGGFGYAAYTIGAKKYRSVGANLVLMALGFAGQSVFLYFRGLEVGRCPNTNVFEILIFLSWAMVLLYLAVGPAYRLSLLGVFTAPLVFLFHLAALMIPAEMAKARPAEGGSDFWLEIHASVSLLAYGAFAMAFVAGVMFLVQNRLLKQHRMNHLFYSLPPITHLGHALVRLLIAGVILLTIGIAAAYGMERSPTGIKLAMSYVVWFLYASLIGIYYFRGLPVSRLASATVGVFALPVFTLWIVSSA